MDLDGSVLLVGHGDRDVASLIAALPCPVERVDADGALSGLDRAAAVVTALDLPEQGATLAPDGAGDPPAATGRTRHGGGVALVEALRRRDADVPLVVWAADGSERAASAAVGAGATDYVRTDDGACTLAARLRSALGVSEPAATVGGDVAVETGAGGSPDGSDVRGADREETPREQPDRLELRERRLEVQLHARRLERVSRINDKIRSLVQVVIEAETREAIGQAVCDRLVDLDRFCFAWIGEPDVQSGLVEPTARAGESRGYLDDVALDLGGAPAQRGAGERRSADREPAVRAVDGGEPVEVANVARSLHAATWRRRALLEDYRSVLAVPLAHDGIHHGVLAIYGNRPAVFDDRSAAVLAELGELIGYAITAVERRDALIDPDVVALSFELQAPEDPFVTLARALGSELEVRNVTPRPGGDTLVHLSASDATPATVRAAAEDAPAVDRVRTVGQSAPLAVELVVTGDCLVTDVADLAATLRSATITEEGCRTTVCIPRDRDVRTFTGRFQERFPEAQLVGRQNTERAESTLRRASSLGGLTDRQREVLSAAYFGGYFEQPRHSTGSEIADTLDISQPAFSKQLRASQRALLEPLYEPGLGSTGRR